MGGGGANDVPSAARQRELYGPRGARPGLCQRAWCAPAVASGRLPSKTVEDGPSRVSAVPWPLVPALLPQCVGLSVLGRGEIV